MVNAQDKVIYGLTKQGIVDKEWFWDEVWLRAVNNYGPWKSRISAGEYLYRALIEVCKDAHVSQTVYLKIMGSNQAKIHKLIKDMCEEEGV